MKFNILRFINNLRYLGRYNLKDMNNKINAKLSNDDLIDQAVYEAQSYKIKKPTILDVEQSLESLLKSGNSVARYGDGEVMIMGGYDIPFQKYDKKLADRLKEIVMNTQQGLSVALAQFFYYMQDITHIKSELVARYCRYEALKFRNILKDYISFDKIYLDTAISGAKNSKNVEMLRLLWECKNNAGGGGNKSLKTESKVLLVCCKEAWQSYQYDIFENVQKEFLFIPNKHAFSQYDSILRDILKYDKDTIIILMAGPTACVLASDLAYKGYRALDLGHIAKYYDYFKRDILAKNDSEMAKFFAPDE